MAITAQQLARQLGDLRPEQRIVCIHPNFTTAHLILTAIWEKAVYLRFQGAVVDAAQAEAQLDAALERRVDQPNLDGGFRYLILDEADRIAPDALVPLLRKLLGDAEPMRVI